MKRTFRSRVSAVLLITVAGFAGTSCDSVTDKDDATEVEFALGGSLTTDFTQVDPAYDGSALFSRSGIANRLDVMLEVRAKGVDRREEARVNFRFAYASNTGVLPPGPYSVVPDDTVPTVGEAFYQLVRNDSSYSKFEFAGTSLRLVVEESQRGRFVATFSLDLEQTHGESFADGQLLNVALAGPVRVSGSFDLEIEGLEPLPGL
ncbi:MAG: hypothetical protein HKN37_13595 [Rhodothermales bacterium]|nr:hypothetical protein [Rhodothermales bacterium]